MISTDRKLILRDLEVFRFFKDNKMLANVIIEDTRGPFTEGDKSVHFTIYEKVVGSRKHAFRSY